MDEAPDQSLRAGGPEQAAALRDANQQLVVAMMRAQAAEDELREAARHKDESVDAWPRAPKPGGADRNAADLS